MVRCEYEFQLVPYDTVASDRRSGPKFTTSSHIFRDGSSARKVSSDEIGDDASFRAENEDMSQVIIVKPKVAGTRPSVPMETPLIPYEDASSIRRRLGTAIFWSRECQSMRVLQLRISPAAERQRVQRHPERATGAKTASLPSL